MSNGAVLLLLILVLFAFGGVSGIWWIPVVFGGLLFFGWLATLGKSQSQSAPEWNKRRAEIAEDEANHEYDYQESLHAAQRTREKQRDAMEEDAYISNSTRQAIYQAQLEARRRGVKVTRADLEYAEKRAKEHFGRKKLER